jgi:hypothetical protein
MALRAYLCFGAWQPPPVKQVKKGCVPGVEADSGSTLGRAGRTQINGAELVILLMTNRAPDDLERAVNEVGYSESFLPATKAMTKKMTKSASATKNKTFATAALPAATPVNPKMPAMIDMTANMIAHLIMIELQSGLRFGSVPRLTRWRAGSCRSYSQIAS